MIKKSSPAGRPPLPQRLRQEMKSNGALYIMALPVVLYYLLFRYLPMGGIVIAFQKFNLAKGIAGSKWIGPVSYTHLTLPTIA